MNKMPPVQSSYFACEGGLDLVTPAMTVQPGRTFDSLNYEPEMSGGYRRIDGYERFNGEPSPTDTAKYVVLPALLTRTVPLGYGINGVDSGVGGRLVGLVPKSGYTLMVLAYVDNATQNYQKGEKLLQHDGIEIGYAYADSLQAELPADDADYQFLAAQDVRNDIDAVPGQGPVRGVFMLNDVIYAFRDTVGGAQQKLWKSSPTGWIEVIYGKEIQFDTGTVSFKEGDTIANSGGTVTAVVGAVLVRTGSFNTGSDPKAKGTIVLAFNSLSGGTFSAGETLYVAGTARCVAATGITDITRFGSPPQKMEIVKYSFGARTGPQVVYGVDGKNLAFEFNGSNFIPIRTRDTGADAPNHVAAHLNYLFLAFGSNIQWSGVGKPYSWDGITGAAEFSAGANVTAMVPMIGGNQAPAMVVTTTEKMSVLYGAGPSTFRLQNSITEIGYAANTVQPISGTAFGLTARGIQTLAATDTFGDFNFTTISLKVQPLINKLRGQEQCSVVLKNKNQYRIYYGDERGTCLVVGVAGDRLTGIMPLEYGRVVRCIWTETFSDGKERTFFGSDDGHVYEDNKGTSFDGEPIESWVRLVFNHQKSPRTRKRWRRAVIEAHVAAFSRVNFTYDLGYGNPDVTPPPLREDAIMVGGTGGYWDQFTWDQFHWDAQTVISPVVHIEGTEKNISLVFYSNRAQDGSHTIQGITLEFTPRRNER